jgi:hypothetical protein
MIYCGVKEEAVKNTVLLLGIALACLSALPRDFSTLEPLEFAVPLPAAPVDDSMWVTVDSVPIGPPPVSFWRGVCLDPNGEHFWVGSGDGTSVIQKRKLADGTVVLSATVPGGQPYDVVRFGDSLCVSRFSAVQLDIYDTLLNFGRSIPTPTGLRGVDWDGASFWTAHTTPFNVYRISPAGAILNTLTATVAPRWMGSITLDRMYDHRLWLTSANQTHTVNNIYYAAIDTVANTWSILDSFSQTPVVGVYPGGLAFDGPTTDGGFVWVSERSAEWLWKKKVHEPVTGIGSGVAAPLGPRVTVTPSLAATGAVSLRFSGLPPGRAVVTVCDAAGRCVLNSTVENGRLSLPPGLPAGAYVARVACGGAFATVRFVMAR